MVCARAPIFQRLCYRRATLGTALRAAWHGAKPGARRRTLVDLQLTCRIPNGAMVEVKVALPLQPETEPAAVTAEALHNVW